MSEPRLGRRCYCSIEECGRKMAAPRWDGHVRNVRFSLCSFCMAAGRYELVRRRIDEMLEEAAMAD